jgi:hypothetical protein
MLCTAGLHVVNPAPAQNRKRKLSSIDSPDDNKAVLCAKSKRKLEAYRATPLEPKEGELANENNEMFEEILQSKISSSSSSGTEDAALTEMGVVPDQVLVGRSVALGDPGWIQKGPARQQLCHL